MKADECLSWLPRAPYYETHAERLAYSFSHLPELPPGFSCLCLGSWGGEVPLLKGHLGADRVVCVRGPEEGIPFAETVKIEGANKSGPYETELYAIDLEKEPLPEELSDFDLVLSWEILEHLRVDPPAMLWEGIKALKIGGHMSVTTPNALWHYLTTAQLFGHNPLGLRLQLHRPFATHWRLYSPAEVSELCAEMGCRSVFVSSFLKTEPFSLKSRLFLAGLQFFRRNSGNGECSYGQHVYVLAQKERVGEPYRPAWLFPPKKKTGGNAHLGE